ncbi:MAG TPA: hypothetical protein VME70_04285 [Mycobacteriales bacterium]|nr:hypothetical protein [Mycobacteriales bacterium]
MLTQTIEQFALAEVEYRQQRIAEQFAHLPRRMSLRWPAGLISPRRHHGPSGGPRPTTRRPAAAR